MNSSDLNVLVSKIENSLRKELREKSFSQSFYGGLKIDLNHMYIGDDRGKDALEKLRKILSDNVARSK